MGLYDMTLQDVVCKNAMARADELAFVCGDVRWTFGQYAEEVDRLASGVALLGVQKGDRIGVIAFNCHQFFLLYGMAARLGAILVPINWRLKPEEIQVILEDCTPKVIVCSPEYTDPVQWLADRCPFVTHKLVIGEPVGDFRPVYDVAAPVEDLEAVDVSQHDPLVIIYTAAVEGRPRGAVLTHGNVVAANLQAMSHMNIQSDAVHLNVMPLFHIMGLETAFSVMHAGGRNVFLKKFDANEAAEWIEREQVTIIPAVPPMLSTILDQAEASNRDLSSLRVVSGLFEQPETVQRCQQMTGAQFWPGFGQTETSGFITTSPYDERPGSSGKEGPLTRIRLVDEYDRDVQAGQPGEVLVKGPSVFQKYWNLEKDTHYTLREGWHHTGDICRLDEKGYLWYVKRKAEKELIKPGGENVYPIEVEKALLEHADVLEACVFGVPDKQWGEAIKAVCTLKPDSALDAQGLIDFVADRIARYKKPKDITFVEALPKAEDGTVDREKVKAEHGAS